ncbi:hypothetical protein K438DRAFT_1768203 [Mycena galopus ATCC 62051]|nr:hypothetical protein K438DRAFT_1768203 [Mycena galopus ATCC 62051]
MHPVLVTPELIALLCHHVLPSLDQMSQYNIPGARSALLALACTCKSLQEPALDALWQEMTSLLPYFCSFPRALFSRSPVHIWQHEPLRLTRPLVSADRAHAHINASRIRKLYVEFNPAYSHVLLAIRGFATSSAIFPNLRGLRWRSATHGVDLHHLAMFLTPALQEISITFDPTTMLNQSLLFSLSSVCPALTRTRRRSGPARGRRVLHFAFHLVGRWNPVSVNALGGLGRVPTHCAALHACNAGSVPFWATCFTWPFIWVLADSHTAPYMARRWPAGLAEHTLFTTLAKYCSHAMLIHLTLEAAWSIADVAPPPPPITAPVLQTLFCFRNLVVLAIELKIQFELDDTNIAATALAWPSLESLTLKAFGCADTTPLTMLSL